MQLAKIITIFCALAMAAAIVYGLMVGNFGAEGAQLLQMPWGIVTLVDVYVGFILFAMWVVYRETSLSAKVVWVVLLMVLGNLIAALYVLLALNASRSDWRRFFLGQHA
ncbi:MAG: DUF1475 family protein [Anaerolineales bacterium]|nr:DUF1475 family protein [Anaerolineales bacterium]